MALKDIAGQRFGRLLVVDRAENDKGGSAMWICVCDCGEKRIVAGAGLRAGRNKSCGCSSPRFASEEVLQHGMSRSRAYSVWAGMRNRCSPMAAGKTARNYYLRGIRVCDEWKSFLNFHRDMGDPEPGMSLDRIDTNGNYEKSNCRWATSHQQANNTRANVVVEYLGQRKTIAEWAQHLGIKQNTLQYRLYRGIPLDRALSADAGHKSSIEASKRDKVCECCGSVFRPRLAQLRVGHGNHCSHKCSAKARAACKYTELDRLNYVVGELVR